MYIQYYKRKEKMPEKVLKSSPAQLRANKKYFEKNKDKIHEIQRQYYLNNKEKIKKKRMDRYYKQKEIKNASFHVESGDSTQESCP
jgi:hypothetical protein